MFQQTSTDTWEYLAMQGKLENIGLFYLIFPTGLVVILIKSMRCMLTPSNTDV